MPDLKVIAQTWLEAFSAAILKGDVDALVHFFLPKGWLRDVLVFTWNTRSLEGRSNIAAYLSHTLLPAQLHKFTLDDSPSLQPDAILGDTICASFTFDMPTRRGRGYVRLLFDTESHEWKALSVFTMTDAIKGYDYSSPDNGTTHRRLPLWQDMVDEQRVRIERNPYVLIMGAGQTGLNIAARFKRMGIPTLVIEKENRIGDVWRKRYSSLSLHTIRNHHTLLYQPYPDTWPQFTPGHKLADWLEQYAVWQELVVWTNSWVLPTPIFDSAEKKWTVVVKRNGVDHKLHPGHIVSAIGTTGPPRIPRVPHRDQFKGTVMHSSEYKGDGIFTGRHVIVIGACASAADICQDAVSQGAVSCTMVQRSSTCVVSIRTSMLTELAIYPDGVPLELSDFKVNSMPLNLAKRLAREGANMNLERDKTLHSKLRGSGLELNMGSDGSGFYFLMYERHGGSWRDRGLSDDLGSGKVKVKNGVEVKRFNRTGVVFTDDTESQADIIVFATGFRNPQESLRTIFGPGVIDTTEQPNGVDHEGEILGYFRPTGHPGLWYGGGDFAMSRFCSKQLGIMIQASQMGLMSQG